MNKILWNFSNNLRNLLKAIDWLEESGAVMTQIAFPGQAPISYGTLKVYMVLSGAHFKFRIMSG